MFTLSFFSREPFPAHVDIRRLSLHNGGGSDSGGGGGDGVGDGVGVGGSGNPLRVPLRDYPERVRHYLGRLGVLQRPKVNRLFHGSATDAKCLRADPIMR